VILRAMQTHGLILADNGSSWFVSGAPDPRWDNDVLHVLGRVHGGDFEVVDTSALVVDPSSGATTGGPPGGGARRLPRIPMSRPWWRSFLR
jgi:hypothetical protein